MLKRQIKHRNDEMILRIAQGDAYCICTEYQKSDASVFNDALSFKKFVEHPDYHSSIKAGSYTDDTQMSIAVAEVILSNDEPTADDFLNAFFSVFKRDPRKGYSSALQSLLENSQTVAEFKQLLIPTSTKNGAAMRSVPIGILRSFDDVMRVAEMQASITHNTNDGIKSSQVVALLSHYALYSNMSFDEICNDVQLKVFGRADYFGEEWQGRVVDRTARGGHDVGLNTVHAVMTLLKKSNGLLDVLRRTIIFGGDTDSVAAIAMGIASARFNGNDLPEFMESSLENGNNYGPAFLRELGKKLMDKFQA